MHGEGEQSQRGVKRKQLKGCTKTSLEFALHIPDRQQFRKESREAFGLLDLMMPVLFDQRRPSVDR